ncbi:TPA: hypothetical protein DCW54_01525 [Candidatus Dependentiae bacterium]|nr:hypothetical protein [Candidatus Dependentiae bacterium]
MNNFCRRLTRSRAAGMTFIEIIFGILIIGLLIGTMAPILNNFMNQAKMRKTDTNLQATKVAIEQFMSDTGSQPPLLDDLLNRPSDPKASARWRGPYADERSLQDGWGAELVYTPGQGGKFQLYSWGKGGEGSEETVVSAFTD